jgi:hypothetical protein
MTKRQQGYYRFETRVDQKFEAWFLNETPEFIEFALADIDNETMQNWHRSHGDLDFSLICALIATHRGYDESKTAAVYRIERKEVKKCEPISKTTYLADDTCMTFYEFLHRVRNSNHSSVADGITEVAQWSCSSEDEWGWDADYSESESESESYEDL